MASTKGNRFVDCDFVAKLTQGPYLSSIDWCQHIFDSILKSKNCWKGKGAVSYYCGPLTILMLHYVDCVGCDGLFITRKRHAIIAWTKQLLDSREKEERKSGRFGAGDFNGPYVEEHDASTPVHERGFIKT